MGRPSKAKAVEVPPPTIAAMEQRVIDVDAFKAVRDSLLQRLSVFHDLFRQFHADYQRQTNMLLAEGTSDIGPELGNLEGGYGIQPSAVAPPVEEKKERKKRTHDPNAPKRPLTPYFLYMQTARPIIAADLGADAQKGAVQNEGQRRWKDMTPVDKNGWEQAYLYNLRLYNARVHSYKGGNANARMMTDEDAHKYADTHSIPMPSRDPEATNNDQQAIVEQLQAQQPAPEAAKTPKSAAKATAGRKRKSTAATPAVEPEAAKVAATPAAAASPDKKRKRASKVTEEKESEPKKAGRKKAKSG